MLAAEGGHLEVVQFLIGSGADLDLQDHWGRTALMLASKWRHKEVVRLLMDSGADTTLRDMFGRGLIKTKTSGQATRSMESQTVSRGAESAACHTALDNK